MKLSFCENHFCNFYLCINFNYNCKQLSCDFKCMLCYVYHEKPDGLSE